MNEESFEEDKNQFWSKGAFAETLGLNEKERMKTFHKKHNEDMNFNCIRCNKVISAHNKDWHDRMCDKCFDEQYFPEEEEDSQSKFEKQHQLSHYIETDEGHEDKLYVDAFFLFLQKYNKKDIQCYKLDEGKIAETLNLSFEEIKDNLYLECEDKGIFYDEDSCISQAFTDNDSFYAIVQKGIIFFSGKDDAVKFMQEALDELKIKYFLDETRSF